MGGVHLKAYFKSRLAEHTPIDVSVLPYNDQVIALLKAEKAKSRQIILATASHRVYAEEIVAYLTFIDKVFATDEDANLSAHRKRDVLVAEFGQKGFDYIGNSRADIPVWESARKAYLINPESGVERRARTIGNVEEVIFSKKNGIKVWFRSLRPHQWLKNLLIFIPVIAAHLVADVSLASQAFLAFIFFSLCASSVYVLNDLVDQEDDLHHPRKKNRPLASGELFWFSVNWRIQLFELAYKNGGIHHAKTAKKLHPTRKGFHSQTTSG